MSWEKEIDDGAAQYGRGEFQKSEETFSSALAKLKGNDSKKAEYAEALEWLGRTQIWLGKLEPAETNLKESREIKEQVFGAQSKQVALADLYLADLAVAKEEFKVAHELATSSLGLIEKETGPNDLAVAEAASRIGLAGSFMDGKGDESESYLNKALGIRRGKLGEDHALVGETLDRLSQCHAIGENFTMAGALGRKALAIKEKALGPDHPEVGVTLYNLSTQYVRTRMFIKGEAVARRGVEVLQKLPPDKAINVRMLERLATICLANGNIAEAEQLNIKALAGAEKVWGKDDPNIVSNLVALAGTYLNKADFQNAEKYFKRALSVLENSSSLDTGLEYSLLQNLSCCYIFQLKIGDVLQLVPASFRAKHTANVTSTLDLIKSAIQFTLKQIDNYKKDRGEYN
jgi:tetratricopeptide (TPR) repeat protein